MCSAKERWNTASVKRHTHTAWLYLNATVSCLVRLYWISCCDTVFMLLLGSFIWSTPFCKKIFHKSSSDKSSSWIEECRRATCYGWDRQTDRLKRSSHCRVRRICLLHYIMAVTVSRVLSCLVCVLCSLLIQTVWGEFFISRYRMFTLSSVKCRRLQSKASMTQSSSVSWLLSATVS